MNWQAKHFKKASHLFINGRFMPGVLGKDMPVCNPADESIITHVALATEEDAEKAVQAARRSFDSGVWSNVSPIERSTVLHRLADLLTRNKSHFMQWLMAETGSTLRKANVEVTATIDGIRVYADLAKSGYELKYITPNGMNTPASINMVNRQPVGVAVGIIPWNWPLFLSMWKMAPALATGNSIILKVANEASLTVMAFADLCHQVGIPAGVLQVINGEGPVVGTYLTKHKMVDKISFTGSTATGQTIMEGAASSFKRITLELGGKSAQIIMEDADLNIAIDGVLFTGFNHAGQTCHNGTRILVPRMRHDELLQRLIDRTKDIVVGHPLLRSDAGMGPIITQKQLDRINDYISLGKQEGAVVAVGGDRPSGEVFTRGYWINPTIMSGVNNRMRVAREEIFGPVLVVIPYDDIDEAIAIANDSPYGLAGNVWSSQWDQALEIAKKIRTGTVWINDASIISNIAPFGGFKSSGLGRESGLQGLLSYTESQHIHLGYSTTKDYYKTLF